MKNLILLSMAAASLFNTASAQNCADIRAASAAIEDIARFKFGPGPGKLEHEIYFSSPRGNNYSGNVPQSWTSLVTAVPKDPKYADIPTMGTVTVMSADCDVRVWFETSSRLR